MKLFLAALAAVGVSSQLTCEVSQYYSPNSGTCKTSPTSGEYCNVVATCAANHQCEANVCVFSGFPGTVDATTAGLGEVCGTGKTCVPGLSCGSGFVEPASVLKPSGESCSKHWECQTKVCNQGVCTVGDQMFLVLRDKREMDGTECDGSQKGRVVPLHCCDSDFPGAPYFPADCVSNGYPAPYEEWGGAFCDLENGGMYFSSGFPTNECVLGTQHTAFIMPRGGCMVGGEYMNDQYYMVVPDTDRFDACDIHKCPGQQLNKLGECEPIPGAVAVGGQCSSHADCTTKACSSGICQDGNKHLFLTKSKSAQVGTSCAGTRGDVVPLSCCDTTDPMLSFFPKMCMDDGYGNEHGWMCAPEGGLHYYADMPVGSNCEDGSGGSKYPMPRGSCIVGGFYADDQYYMVIPDSQAYVCDYGACSGAATLSPEGKCVGACGAQLGSAGNGGEIYLIVTVSSEDSIVGIDFDALSEAAVVENVQMYMWAKVSDSHWEGRLGFQNSTVLANHLVKNAQHYSVVQDSRITVSAEMYNAQPGAVGNDVRAMVNSLGWTSREFQGAGYIRHPHRAEGTLSEDPITCISAEIIANMDAVPDWNEWEAGWRDLVEPSLTRSDIHTAFWGFNTDSKQIKLLECFSGDGAAGQAKVAADVLSRRVHYSASYGNRYTFGMTNAKTSASFAVYAPYMQNDYVFSAGPSAGFIVNPKFLDYGEPMCYGPNGECRVQFANRAFEYVTSGSFNGTPFAYTILVSLLAEDKLKFEYLAVDHGGQGDIYSEVGYSVTQDPEPKRGGLFRHDLSSDVVLMSWMEHPVGASVFNVYDAKYGRIFSVLTYSGENAGDNFGLQMKGTNDLTEVTMPSVHPSFQEVDFTATALTGRTFAFSAGGSSYEMTFNDETTLTEVVDGMSDVKSVSNNGMWRKDISPDIIQIGWSDATKTGASVVAVFNLADMKLYTMAAFIHADFFAGGDPDGLLGTEIFELHHLIEM